ncbi:MAG TPA: hypothetical protein VNH16_25195 [Burkholderiales bacterium]|jgi:hypothetical protein|nr:hypothetical protein [Burkholderiales bacterium]
MATLYKTCPKCGAAAAGLDTCAACGLIFAKYLRAKFASPPPQARPANAAPDEDGEDSLLSQAKALVLYVPEELDRGLVYGRVILLAAIAFYGARLALMDIPSWEMAGSLIHLPMVPIHEFGHVLFRPLGEFMTLLGGSLFQVLLPLIFGGIFVVKNRDPFAASVMLWWAAVAVMDVAPYVYDAFHPQHILLTGRTGDNGAHDFIDVLGDLGLLHKAQPIGRGVHVFGLLMMITALAWGAWIVWRQYRRVR